ncbi:flavin-containing monooxygenase [Tropicimonas sediminicola]|uniref:Putative flavoprotein involved in K+ transport n=1 Tax=Tropicimonas sediminicola TaxID=1031541 RepID=A0A239FVZ2_9RHOB|nr:NAD(P)/FAD-dependent oxidoreductase [Tropicimonas sediminicola]SNS60342.1 putative flavoprotein involved in K+ transport [Tropicimonas sediminicola]
MIRKTDVLIIGAGQAGLAMSHCLTGRGIDHVVLDRGAVGQRWRAERWASLHLLTPNWMTRLPGWRYEGADPDGYMHKDEVVGMLNRYARSFAAPVEEFTDVEGICRTADGFCVVTRTDLWTARSVVVATGACDRPAVPGFADEVARDIEQVTTATYVHPGQLDKGGVLVVGASATGVQLAEEIHLSGRPVTLAAGGHVRLPRRYRGRDILDWLDRSDVLAERRDPSVADARALSQPSLQLVGSSPPRDIDLMSLSRLGVTVIGRVESIGGNIVHLADNLPADILAAEARRERTLSRIDAFIHSSGDAAPEREAHAPLTMPVSAGLRGLDLRSAGIRTIVWATGFRRSYPWLQLPVFDAAGEILQTGGITPCPGLYTLGLPFMRRRNSTFIDGVGQDAIEIAVEIARHLERTSRAAA